MILCSGGFDPLHEGHIEYLERAGLLDEVVVALNSDAWLIRKKGYYVMGWAVRRKLLLALKSVSDVVVVDDADGTVGSALRVLRPRYFGKGGDRGPTTTPEADLCKELGIEVIYGLGDKVNSSSGIILPERVVERAWGTYRVLYDGPGLKVKMLEVRPGCSTSVQSHRHRCEHWLWPDNRYRKVPAGEKHWLTNPDRELMRVVEVQTGHTVEDDIERYG